MKMEIKNDRNKTDTGSNTNRINLIESKVRSIDTRFEKNLTKWNVYKQYEVFIMKRDMEDREKRDNMYIIGDPENREQKKWINKNTKIKRKLLQRFESSNWSSYSVLGQF